MTGPAATISGGNTVMQRTLVRVTIYCDTPGCPAVGERVLANGEPRALLTAVRRSLRRRDGWAVASRSRLFGPVRDLCPACQAAKAATQDQIFTPRLAEMFEQRAAEAAEAAAAQATQAEEDEFDPTPDQIAPVSPAYPPAFVITEVSDATVVMPLPGPAVAPAPAADLRQVILPEAFDDSTWRTCADLGAADEDASDNQVPDTIPAEMLTPRR